MTTEIASHRRGGVKAERGPTPGRVGPLSNPACAGSNCINPQLLGHPRVRGEQ